jgi:hypothetical protein
MGNTASSAPPVQAPAVPVQAPAVPLEAPAVPLEAPAVPLEAPAVPLEAPVAPAPDWLVALSAMNPQEKRAVFRQAAVDYTAMNPQEKRALLKTPSVDVKKKLADIKTERNAQAKGIENIEDDVTYDQLQNENTKINADVFLNIKAYNYRTLYTEENKRNIQKRIWFNINYLQFKKWKYIQEYRIVQKRFGNNFPNVPFAIKNEFPDIYKIQEEKGEKNRRRKEDKLLL